MEPSELLIPLAAAGFGFLLRGVIPPLPAKPAGESEMWVEAPVSAHEDALKHVEMELERAMKDRAHTLARVEEVIAKAQGQSDEMEGMLSALADKSELRIMEKVGAFLEPIRQELLESQARLARLIEALTDKQQADNDGLALALKEDKQRLIECHSQWAALEDRLNEKLKEPQAAADVADLPVEDLKQMLNWAYNDAAPALRRHQEAFNGLAQLNIGEFGQAMLELQDRTEALEDLLRGLLPESAQAGIFREAWTPSKAENWMGTPRPPLDSQAYAPQQAIPVAPPVPEEIPPLPADPQEVLNALRRQADLGFPPDMQQRFISGNGR